MVWVASGRPGTDVGGVPVQMSRLLPLNERAKCIINPSPGHWNSGVDGIESYRALVRPELRGGKAGGHMTRCR